MFRFFIVIIASVLFTHDSFAACETGYYEPSFTFPTTDGYYYGYISNNGKDKYAASGLSNGQWHTVWNSGTAMGEAKGIATCNSTEGTFASSSGSDDSWTNSASATGSNCWCKITAWIPDGGISKSLTAAWVFSNVQDTAYNCLRYCSSSCASKVHYNSDFRSAVFGAVQTPCTACPAKPSNATWTTGCNYACPAGTYAFVRPTAAANSYGYYGAGYPSNSGTTPVNLSYAEWRVTWTSGDVQGSIRGEATCKGKEGTRGFSEGSDDTWTKGSSDGKYCWCRITEWIPAGGNAQSLNAKWVYVYGESSYTRCNDGCRSNCGSFMQPMTTVGNGMFDTVENTCLQCPDGGISTVGSTAITQCYLPANTNYTNDAGTHYFSSNCYYTN